MSFALCATSAGILSGESPAHAAPTARPSPPSRPETRRYAANIAASIGCAIDRVNVKGKTKDGFGPEGQGQAISATVLVQLQVDETAAGRHRENPKVTRET